MEPQIKLDLTGRQCTDITPLLQQVWTESNFGETIELPQGVYYARPVVFPALRPWGETRITIEGSGVQGTSTEPDPGYLWQPGEVIWTFAAARIAVRNISIGGKAPESWCDQPVQVRPSRA